jgi:hypothetical protein
LSAGEIRSVIGEDDGKQYFSFRSLKAGKRMGSREEQVLSNTKKVSKEQATLLGECFRRLKWSLKYTDEDAQAFVEDKKIPPALEEILTKALEAQQHLAKDGYMLIKKWTLGETADLKGLRKGHAKCQTFVSKLQHLREFRELPDSDEPLNKSSFDRCLLEIGQFTEEYNCLVESCKGKLRASRN